MNQIKTFLSELPFNDLDDQEFLKITGGWVHVSTHTLLESKDLYQDIIKSPERESDSQDNPNENYNESKYYTIKQSGNIFNAAISNEDFH